MLGHDFTAFYSAGQLAASGQFEKLYDIEAVKTLEQQTGRKYGLSLGDSYGPYWNPPFYAWIFAPLSRLPYPTALLVWTLFNVTCFLVALYLICNLLAPCGYTLITAKIPWHVWGLVPLLLTFSMPVIQALSHGQNSMTSLLLLAATVTAWRNERAILAGLVGGLLFYKPQLGAIVAVLLIITLGSRALLGLAITGLLLTIVTVITMPGALLNFLTRLPANVRFMQVDHAYVWERHVTLKAFWRLLLQGRSAGGSALLVTSLTGVTCLAIACSLCVVIHHYMRSVRTGEKLDRIIAATIVSMPLLMPFYFDYDLMLLAIPAALFAGEQFRFPGQAAERWIIRVGIVMYLWMFISPGIAAKTHFNGTIPLLATLAAMLIRRASQPVQIADAVAEQLSQLAPQRMLASAPRSQVAA
jgi:alpha-1,2-mannosyltransferase